MKTLNQLAKKYRQQIQHKKHIQEKLAVLRDQEISLQRQIDSMDKDIWSTKQLIDYCVLTGDSPVQAVLQNNREDINRVLSNHDVAKSAVSMSQLAVSNMGQIYPSQLALDIHTGISLAPQRLPGSAQVPGV